MVLVFISFTDMTSIFNWISTIHATKVQNKDEPSQQEKKDPGSLLLLFVLFSI
jgi:hypothetical protein